MKREITLARQVRYSYDLSEDGKIENIKCEAEGNINSDDIAIELFTHEFYKTHTYQLELTHFDKEDDLYILWWYHEITNDTYCNYGRMTSSGAKIFDGF